MMKGLPLILGFAVAAGAVLALTKNSAARSREHRFTFQLKSASGTPIPVTSEFPEVTPAEFARKMPGAKLTLSSDPSVFTVTIPEILPVSDNLQVKLVSFQWANRGTYKGTFRVLDDAGKPLLVPENPILNLSKNYPGSKVSLSPTDPSVFITEFPSSYPTQKGNVLVLRSIAQNFLPEVS